MSANDPKRTYLPTADRVEHQLSTVIAQRVKTAMPNAVRTLYLDLVGHDCIVHYTIESNLERLINAHTARMLSRDRAVGCGRGGRDASACRRRERSYRPTARDAVGGCRPTVVGMTRSDRGAQALRALGAEPVVADALDA